MTLADAEFTGMIMYFMAGGLLPTYFFSDNFIMNNKEDDLNKDYDDAKTYLSYSMALKEINKTIKELENTHPSIIENITSTQEQFILKTKSLEVQKDILNKLCI